MLPVATRLHAALLAELRSCGAGGEAVERLDRDLAALLALPFRDQRETPGELFRQALDAAGLAEAPLSEEAHRAHLAWGVAKAQAYAAPSVLYLGNDLMDRSKIAAAVEAAGLALRVAASGEPDPGGALRAFVDLTHPGADDAIRTLAAAGVTTVAFGPHVDDVALVRARSLGADDALARSVFFRRLPELLPARA